MPRTKRNRETVPSPTLSDTSEEDVEIRKLDSFLVSRENIFFLKIIFSAPLLISLISKSYLPFLVTIPLKIYLESPARGKTAHLTTTVEIEKFSTSIRSVNSGIIDYLNSHRRDLGLERIPTKSKLNIWFVYSTYAKMKLKGATKSKFFSKLDSEFISKFDFTISLHDMKSFVSNPGQSPAKKQRQKIGDLRRGLDLTATLTANQQLLTDIAPANLVARAGTANLVDSAATTVKNGSAVSQKSAIETKINTQIYGLFTSVSQLASLSSNTVIEQEDSISDFRKSLRLAYSTFQSSLEFNSPAQNLDTPPAETQPNENV